MSLSIKVEAVEARPGPERALLLSVSIVRHGDAPAADLLHLEGRLSFGGRVLTDSVRPQELRWHDGPSASLPPAKTFLSATLAAPLSSAALRFTEKTRRDEDLAFELFIFATVQERRGAESRNLHFQTSAVMRPVARSHWLKLLRGMEWTELELFELPTAPLLADQKLAIALQLLREAEDELRLSHHKGVLSKCHEAFDSAAKHEVAGDNTKKGFELLLSRVFHDPEIKKRSPVDGLIRALRDFAQFGRHPDYPAMNVSREEAEFTLQVTLAVFALLAQRLAATTTSRE